MTGFIEIDANSLLQMERLKRKFSDLLDARLVDIGTEAAGKYILNIFVRKEIPPYRYISRKSAYGKTWFSEKQRRKVMAMIRSGEINIPYKRRSPNSGLSASWFMEGSGSNLMLVNKAPHSPFIYGEEQARQIGMIGWRRASTILEEYEGRATDSAARAIDKEIKRIMQEDAT